METCDSVNCPSLDVHQTCGKIVDDNINKSYNNFWPITGQNVLSQFSFKWIYYVDSNIKMSGIKLSFNGKTDKGVYNSEFLVVSVFFN